MIPRDTATVDLAVPDGDPASIRAAARRLRLVADTGLATAGVRGEATDELAGVWTGSSATQAGRELSSLSLRARTVLPLVDDGGQALAAYATALESAITAARVLSGQARRATDEQQRTLARIDLTHATDPVLHAAAVTQATQAHATEVNGIHRRYGTAMDVLSAAATRCARTLTGLTPSTSAASPIPAAPTLDPSLVDDLPLVRGQLDAAAGSGVGHAAPPEESSWYDPVVNAAGTAGAWTYNHTAVPLVNGTANAIQAGAEHPEDLAQMAFGTGMMFLGVGGEVGGFALDATGVGAVAGVPINVAAAGAVVGGVATAGSGAGRFIQHARANDNRLLQEADAPKSGRRVAGDPLPDSMRPDAAGSSWEGRVAANRKGDVWQAPGKVDPGKGKPQNMDMLRIEDPDWRYEYGCVRFYNSHGQPLTIEGRTGRDTAYETHIKIAKDGTFPVPKGWNPQ